MRMQDCSVIIEYIKSSVEVLISLKLSNMDKSQQSIPKRKPITDDSFACSPLDTTDKKGKHESSDEAYE